MKKQRLVSWQLNSSTKNQTLLALAPKCGWFFYSVAFPTMTNLARCGFICFFSPIGYVTIVKKKSYLDAYPKMNKKYSHRINNQNQEPSHPSVCGSIWNALKLTEMWTPKRLPCKGKMTDIFITAFSHF